MTRLSSLLRLKSRFSKKPLPASTWKYDNWIAERDLSLKHSEVFNVHLGQAGLISGNFKHTVSQSPTTAQWAPALNSDVFQSCVLSHFLATNCLFLEQTIRSSKIRFYFCIWTYSGPWVLYTWNRCRGSNTRAGHTNMFAVTSLCQMTNSGEMKMYYVTSMGWLLRWQYTKECRGLGIWFAWATCAVPARRSLNPEAWSFRYFNVLPCSSELKLPGNCTSQNMSHMDEWRDLSGKWSSKRFVIGGTRPCPTETFSLRVQTNISG